LPYCSSSISVARRSLVAIVHGRPSYRVVIPQAAGGTTTFAARSARPVSTRSILGVLVSNVCKAASAPSPPTSGTSAASIAGSIHHH
jgi:hypothetical protein